MTKKEKKKSIFVEREQLTLSVKLTATFAITYYGLYFLFTTFLGIFYRSVFDPSYLDNTVNDQSEMYALIDYLTLWLTLGMIVFSLIALFRKKHYGKYLFMIFTVILIIHQIYDSSSSNILPLVIEFIILLVIAPLRVFREFSLNPFYHKEETEKNKKETETDNNSKNITE